MSETPNPTSSVAAAAAGGSTADASQVVCVLVDLKKHAEEVFKDLQAKAPISGATSADDTEQPRLKKLWNCIRQSILDDQSGRLLFRQFIKKDSAYFAKKDEVLTKNSLIQKLVATYAPGEEQDEDIEEKRAEVENLARENEVALAELKPMRLTLYKSILASVACRFGTETQPSAFLTEQVAKARALPKEQDPLKHMQSVIKEAVASCWQAHGINDNQVTLENDWARLEEDDDLKLLKPAAKWPNSWCVNEFKPVPKPPLLKAAKVLAPAPAAPATTADSAPPASGCITLADVTGPVELKPADGNSAHTELIVPVKITCKNLCKGRLIRIEAVDCVVGGQIAYFVKQDGKTAKLPEANCNEFVTLVLQVMHQPGLLISTKPHVDMRITPFDDDEHSRWFSALLLQLQIVSQCPCRYKAMMMLDELREAASPWVDQVMKNVWKDIKQELLDGSSKEDGSTLDKSSLPHFPLLKDGSYTLGDEPVVPTASEVLWFQAIMKHHADPAHTKLVNSQLKLWAHPDQGYIEVMKLFCNSLGGHEASKNKRCVADLDAEAVFKIIFNCKAFHSSTVAPAKGNSVKAAANEAGSGRNTIIHVPTPKLKEKEYETVVKQLSLFEQMLVQCKVVAASRCIVRSMKWMQCNLADARYKEVVELHKRIKELRNNQLQHDVIDQLLPPQPNARGERQLLLQASADVIAKLQKDWAPGSREALKSAISSGVVADGSRVNFWLHAQRGRGKSSVMSQLVLPSAWTNQPTCVVRHFFKRGDPASSLNVALASMCVQLWFHFFRDDFETAYNLFDKNMLAADGCSIDVSELTATLSKKHVRDITDKVLIPLLTKVDSEHLSSVGSPLIVMLFDALDEAASWKSSQRDDFSVTIDAAEWSNIDPHEIYLQEVFQPVLAVPFQNIRTALIASSTRACRMIPHITAIAVDTPEFFEHEDARLIVKHKIESYWPGCRLVEQLCTALCNLPSGTSLDLRFLDERCRVMIEQTKRRLANDASCSDRDINLFLDDMVKHTGSMALVEIVQLYMFQQMLYALPDAHAIEQWQHQVEMAFDTLVLAAVLGVDSVSTDLLHRFVCRKEPVPTPEQFEILLKTLLFPILSTVQVDGIIHFQPDYMDAVRSSGAKVDSANSVRKMMELVLPRKLPLSTPSVLENRYQHSCFDSMSKCLTKTPKLAKCGIQILTSRLVPDQPIIDWISLLNCAMYGGSSFMICWIFNEKIFNRVATIRGNEMALQLQLCSRSCDALDDAFSNRPKCGIWIHDCHSKMESFCKAARYICDRCHSQQQVLFFRNQLMAFMRINIFIERHAHTQSPVVEIDSPEDTEMTRNDIGIPFPIMTWARICLVMKDAHAELQDAMPSMFSPADCFNILLLVQSLPSKHNRSIKGAELPTFPLHEVASKAIHELNDTTWSILLNFSSSAHDTIRVLEEMQRRGMQPNDVHWALVFRRLEIKRSRNSYGVAMIQELEQHGLVLGEHLWHFKISRMKGIQEVEDAFRLMDAQGLQPNQRTWKSLLRHYHELSEKEGVIRRMLCKEIVPAVDLWNSVIRCCTTSDDKERIVCWMAQKGVQLDNKTFEALFNSKRGMGIWAPTKEQMWQLLKQLVDLGGISIFTKFAWPYFLFGCRTKGDREKLVGKMMSTGIQPTLVDDHAPEHVRLSFSEAAEILDIMVAMGVPTTADDWDYVMRMAPKKQHSQLVSKMNAAGVQLGPQNTNKVACEKLKALQHYRDRKAALQAMISNGLQPDERPWQLVIDKLSQEMEGLVVEKKIKHLLQQLKDMLKSRAVPDYGLFLRMMEWVPVQNVQYHLRLCHMLQDSGLPLSDRVASVVASIIEKTSDASARSVRDQSAGSNEGALSPGQWLCLVQSLC